MLFLKAVHVSLESVGERAFAGCSCLETIVLKNVRTIPKCAFSNCFLLKSQVLDAVSIGERAFENCANMDFVLARRLQSCEVDAFLGCGCTLESGFVGCLADVERGQVDVSRLQYLDSFRVWASDPKNYLLSNIRVDK